MLVNQLVNDFAGTYEKSRIIFYGATMDEGRQAAELAKKIGYQNFYSLFGDFQSWNQSYPNDTQFYYSGVESVDTFNGSFIMTGFINNNNFENVSIYGTDHGIVYKGGGLQYYGLLQSDMAPFPFQELLTYLGAIPQGNMADGIYYGEYSAKFVNGQRIDFEVAWSGAAKYYTLDELFVEKASASEIATPPFAAVGIEPRIGGTRESNINWNPGCIFCFYSCVCGISSNAKSNDNIWFETAAPRLYGRPEKLLCRALLSENGYLPRQRTADKNKVRLLNRFLKKEGEMAKKAGGVSICFLMLLSALWLTGCGSSISSGREGSGTITAKLVASQADFPNANLLVSADSVQSSLGAKNLVIIDARIPNTQLHISPEQ